MKDTFVFYRSWQNVIGELPEVTQLEIYRAIAEYALNGNSIVLSDVAKVAFAFIRQDLDRDMEKYTSVCARNKLNARNAGAPKGNQNARKRPTKQSKTIQNNRGGIDHDNDNDNDNDIIKKESIREKTPSQKELEFERFNQWIDENASYIRKIKNQITMEQYVKLTERYNGEQIRSILSDLSNYKDAPKKYVSVYATFSKWAKKEYGN